MSDTNLQPASICVVGFEQSQAQMQKAVDAAERFYQASRNTTLHLPELDELQMLIENCTVTYETQLLAAAVRRLANAVANMNH